MMSNFTVIIPARMHSTRLPRKALQLIENLPMIQHVWNQAILSNAHEVIVATDHQEIAQACEKFNAKVCLTSVDHTSGTTRIAEVIDKLNIPDDQIIVNLQGDEPLMPPQFIQKVAQNLQTHKTDIATLATPITDENEIQNPNVVKVVLNCNNKALYFSRSQIPYPREACKNYNFLQHIGIYAYTAGFVKKYVNYPPCQLEVMESLEQLRALFNGHSIHVETVLHKTVGVDTKTDLLKVRKVFKSLKQTV